MCKGFWCRFKRFLKNCKLGQVVKVDNANPSFAANEFYYAVEVCKDGVHVNLLFTEKELQNAAYRAERNPEDIPSCNGCNGEKSCKK